MAALKRHATRRCKAHTVLRITVRCSGSFAKHFPQRWHFVAAQCCCLCWPIKSPPEWQMADQAQRVWTGGCLVRREGREGKGGRPAVTKVFLGGWRVRGQGSICCGLRGHCGARERPVAVVCAALAFQACGWILIWAWGPDKGDLLQLAWDDTREAHAGQS